MQSAEPSQPALGVRIDSARDSLTDFEKERAELWAGLKQSLPRVDSKFFYDDEGSRLFEEITRLPEYYQTRTEIALLESLADDIVRDTGAFNLVELGSGAGRKVRLLLDSMVRSGRQSECVLLDVNEMFLRSSAERLAVEFPGLAVRGVVGDFTRDLAAVGPGRDRLFIFFAGTIGNLNPRELPGFLSMVRATMGWRDHFLVGVDLVKDRARLEAAYNDAAGVTAEFNRNILRVLNARFGTDFDVQGFDHVAFWNPTTQWIEMRLRARYPMRVNVPPGGRFIDFDAGADIRTELSCKFTRRSLKKILDGTGLRLTRWTTDPDQLFGLALMRPTAVE